MSVGVRPVVSLNATIRDQRRADVATGDSADTRRNDADLGVANRQTWTDSMVTARGERIGLGDRVATNAAAP